MLRRSAPMAALLLVLFPAISVSGAEPTGTVALMSPTGEPVKWADFVAENGPLAVVVWASWAPRAEEVRKSFGELDTAARVHGLEMVVVDVQEPIGEARKRLEFGDLRWLHDRHGTVMKSLRAVRVPAVVIVTEDGAVVARLEPTPDALRSWIPK